MTEMLGCLVINQYTGRSLWLDYGRQNIAGLQTRLRHPDARRQRDVTLSCVTPMSVAMHEFQRFDPSRCRLPRPSVPLLPSFKWAGISFDPNDTTSRAVLAGPSVRHFSRGRYAMHAAHKAAGVGPAGALLAPSYHCRTMLDPALALGGTFQLYRLNANLTPQLDSIKALVATSSTPIKALVLTHYFGFSQPHAQISEIAEFCSQSGVGYESRWFQHLIHYRTQAATLLVTVVRAVYANQALPVPMADNKTALAVDVYSHPDALPPEAKRLMAKAEQDNVELGLAWYCNLVNTVYPDCDGVRFYVLRHGTQVLAVLPLRAEKVRPGWRLYALGNYYTALYEPAMVRNLKPHDLTTLLAVVRNDFAGVSSFRLFPMNRESHSYQTLLGALQLQGWMTFEFFAFGNWYLPVKGSWQDYLTSRDGKLRNTLKRMTKKFASNGGTLQLVTKAADMPAAIAAYEQVYAKSWKKPEPFADFSPGLLHTCASQGWLRLGLAWLNGQPIAAQLWIVAHGRAEIFKLAYDEAFKAHAPGTLLSAMLMQHVFEVDKVHEVDYLIGDDPYKKTWVTNRRERWGIVAYNPRTLMGLFGLARELLGRWVRPWLLHMRRPQTGNENIH